MCLINKLIVENCRISVMTRIYHSAAIINDNINKFKTFWLQILFYCVKILKLWTLHCLVTELLYSFLQPIAEYLSKVYLQFIISFLKQL